MNQTQPTGREIERKLIVGNDLTQPEIDYILTRLLNPSRSIYGRSTDYYYDTPGEFDFIRLRLFEDSTAEITGKRKDQGSNFNRLELNLTGIATPVARQFCKAAWGEAVHSLTKQYSVFTPSFEPSIDVSTYVIEGVDKVFLEVEGASEETVEKMVTALKRELVLEDEPRSLFEMYVESAVPMNLRKLLGF